MSGPASNEPPPEGPAPRVLVVDDEPDVLEFLVTVLTQGGFSVTGCGDGDEAARLLEDETFDVLLTDLRLPGRDGLAVIEQVRALGRAIQCIILTGRGTFDDARRAVQLGAFDFIAKPIESIEALVVRVRNAVRQKRLEAERENLRAQLQQRNAQLRMQVQQLQEACRILSEQSRTLNEDLDRAESIQRALLPQRVPPAAGYHVNSFYRPSQKVGGDLYDVIRLGNDHLVAYVADAAGHGVSAAVLAVLFKHRIPVIADLDQTPSEPAKVFEAVNRALLGECAAPGLFVTAAYVLLEISTGRVVLASAGHPPLLLARRDGTVERLSHTGPALGLSAEARFAQTHLTLEEGERLLIYTDGLHAGGCETPWQQSRRLAEAFASHADVSGSQLLRDLANPPGEPRPQSQEDDVTMVLLGRGAGESTLDHGRPLRKLARPVPLHGGGGTVLMGRYDSLHAAVSIQGRGDWKFCTSFHDTCCEEIDAGHDLRVDLSVCESLDSTFLGTLHEIVSRAEQRGVAVEIQGMLPGLRENFQELGMEQVLTHDRHDSRELPRRMEPLGRTGGDGGAAGFARMLSAHTALVDLSEENRRQFGRFVETLRAELEHTGEDGG